jgi:23S rRNA (cytosine1962-C5)-methyltransferase
LKKSSEPPGASLPRLRLRVSAVAESNLRAGHPWLFADSIQRQNRPGHPGELAVVYDRNDRFLAVGFFDPDSPIRMRVLHAGKPQTIDQAWWRGRRDQALARRHGLFDENTTGYRCINGESDGWPGLVLDRFDTTLVLKLYTAIWLPRLSEILELLAPACSRVVLRLSRNIQGVAADRFQCADGQVLRGETPLNPVVFRETSLRFEADVILGQKTGFFLDQRENRRDVEKLAGGRDVLNAFSFSGGFSLYAARGGARSVTDLDISPRALEAARRNFTLNESDPAMVRCHHETVQADAFDWLAQQSEPRFDLVILDPPSLARRESDRPGAVHAYGRLAASAIDCLRPGGVLLAASCSAHVTAGEFFDTIRESARRSGRTFEELKTTRHAPDHPAAFKEAEYLKALYLIAR